MPHYRLFGCDVASDLALPGVPAAAGVPDIDIRLGAAPAGLARPRGVGVCYSAAPGEALIALPGIGRYHVRGGTEIVVEPAPGATDAVLRLFLLNLAFGVLLLQRGEPVLHAAVVAADGGCIALAGASSSGKSTLAAALHGRGFRVLTDEICVVRSGRGGAPTVVPGPPRLEVWGDALRRLGHDPGRLERVRPGLGKYTLPLGPAFADQPLPLREVHVLSPRNRPGVESEVLRGQDRIAALVQHTFRFEYIDAMGLGVAHFGRVAALARRVPVARLNFAKHPGAFDEEADVLAGALDRMAARAAVGRHGAPPKAAGYRSTTVPAVFAGKAGTGGATP